MRALWALVVVSALPGCAAVNEGRWYLNGRTQEQFRADRQQCLNYAADEISDENLNSAGRMMGSRQGGLGAAMVMLEGVAHDARFSACMNGIGYRPAPQ